MANLLSTTVNGILSSNTRVSISGTNTLPIDITGASHKYLTINPGNGWEAMVRYIGGSGSSWYVGKRTSGQLVGTQSFHFYSEEAGATVGGITPGGDMHTTGSMRAPIFYDSNNTDFYLDPNASTSGYFAGTLRQNVGKYVRDSHYRTVSGYGDYYSGGNAGWTRVAEIRLTSNCSGAVLYGTLYDHRYDGADAYQISIVARAECDFTSNNESHYINVGCTITGSTAYSNYRDKIRVLLIESSAGSRKYEVQFYETNWNHNTWQLESNGWTILSSAEAPSASVGGERVNYISNQNADNVRANSATYSPIYYDSNDTGYYLDPNSTSNLLTVNILNTYVGNAIYFGGGNNYFNWDGARINSNVGIQSVVDMRAPIFYDNQDTAYYVDPNSTSNLNYLNLGNTREEFPLLRMGAAGRYSIGVSGAYTRISSHNQGSGVQLGFYDGTTFTPRLTVNNDGNVTAESSLRAPIFYDSGDTGYYLDPNDTSNLNQLNTATRTRWNMPRYWTNRTSYTSDEGYWTGTNGWGKNHGTWANAWQGGFSGWDIWGEGTDHPQGAGYVHAQGIVSGQHYANSSVGYGWMMVGAANATANRYWLRGKWDTTTSGWVEMITTGNIASQSVSYADESGYSASSGSVEWGNVNSRPTALSQFTNDLGNYGGWLTTSGKAADSELLDGINSSSFVRSDQNAVTVQRHLDASTTWTSDILSLFLGWYSGKIVIGNNNDGNHDSASALGGNTIAVTNTLYSFEQTNLYYDNSLKLYMGSDGTRNTGWAYHTNNGTGLHWPNNGWHLMPASTADFRVYSGSGSESSLRMETAGNIRGYVYANSSNEIGFLNNDRNWRVRVYPGGAVESYGDFRAPIFYDSNDTGYYGDFAGFSRMSEIGVTNNYNYNYDQIDSGRAVSEFGVVGKYVAKRSASADYPSFSFEHTYGNHSWGQVARFHIGAGSGTDRPSIQFSSGFNNTRWAIGYCYPDDNFRITQNMGQRPDGSGSDGWGTVRFVLNTNGVVDVPQGYVSNGNPWGTSNSAFFPNGITTAGSANWIYGTTTYIGNAPSNGSGHDFSSSGHQYSTGSITTPTFIVNNHSDNTRGYRIYNTSGTSVSAMFTNSSNYLVIGAGAFGRINLNKDVHVNSVSLGVGSAAPSGTAGRIDASNDIVAYSSSDERLKQNITPIENALDKVKSLTGVEFDWKPEYKHAHGYEGHDTGIIAQQVQEVIPSAVRTNDTGFLAVRYEKLIGLLVEGMKEQQAQIEELKAKLDGLTK